MISKYQATPRDLLITWLDISDITTVDLIEQNKKLWKTVDRQANKIKKLKEEFRKLLEENIKLTEQNEDLLTQIDGG